MVADWTIGLCEVVFWCAFAFVAYVAVLFPAVVLLRGRLLPNPPHCAKITPSLSVIIVAQNDATTIGEALQSLVQADYPRGQFEILVASEGSTDATNEIVESFSGRGVRLLRLPARGRASALNQAVAASHGEILVFTDPASVLRPRAFHALVQPFADAFVGSVMGSRVYGPITDADRVDDGELWHHRLEHCLTHAASRSWNAIGAGASLRAIRRSLFQSVPDGVTDGFVTSARVIARRFRLVCAPDAEACFPPNRSTDCEFEHRVNVIARGLYSLLLLRELLNPLRHGFYSLQLLSQKLLRRLVVFPLLALLVVSPILWNCGVIYQAATWLQVGFYGFAAGACLLHRTRIGRSKAFAVPWHICLVNAAAFCAVVKLLRQRRGRIAAQCSAGNEPELRTASPSLVQR